MAKRRQSTHDIKRGNGYITERTGSDNETRYQARWFDGTRWRAKTFRQLEQAEDHLRDIGRAKRADRYTPESDITVAEIVTEYIARGEHRWSTNTVATYRLLAKQHITPHIGTLRIVTLTTRQVQHWLDTLTSKRIRHPKGEKRELSPAVIENARTVLSGACKEAMQLGVIPANPVSGTRAPSRQRSLKVIWTAEDIRAVLSVVAADPLYRAYYLVALTTGMRPGELRALQWHDIDTNEGIITCQRTMTRTADYKHMIGDSTKTGRARSIAVPASTLEALKKWRRTQNERRLQADAWHDLDIVFDRGDGNPLAQQSVATHHRIVCEKAGVDRCRLHDLRHTAATMMLRNRVHPKVVSEILGHSSISTTLDIYSHVDVDMQRLATDAIADAIADDKHEFGA